MMSEAWPAGSYDAGAARAGLNSARPPAPFGHEDLQHHQHTIHHHHQRHHHPDHHLLLLRQQQTGAAAAKMLRPSPFLQQQHVALGEQASSGMWPSACLPAPAAFGAAAHGPPGTAAADGTTGGAGALATRQQEEHARQAGWLMEQQCRRLQHPAGPPERTTSSMRRTRSALLYAEPAAAPEFTPLPPTHSVPAHLAASPAPNSWEWEEPCLPHAAAWAAKLQQQRQQPRYREHSGCASPNPEQRSGLHMGHGRSPRRQATTAAGSPTAISPRSMVRTSPGMGVHVRAHAPVRTFVVPRTRPLDGWRPCSQLWCTHRHMPCAPRRPPPCISYAVQSQATLTTTSSRAAGSPVAVQRVPTKRTSSSLAPHGPSQTLIVEQRKAVLSRVQSLGQLRVAVAADPSMLPQNKQVREDMHTPCLWGADTVCRRAAAVQHVAGHIDAVGQTHGPGLSAQAWGLRAAQQVHRQRPAAGLPAEVASCSRPLTHPTTPPFRPSNLTF